MLATAAVLLFFANNVVTNLAARGMAVSFDFLGHKANFDIPFHLVAWDANFPYGRALWVSGVNTLFAASLSILVSSAIGLTLALMRLSGNLLAAATARVVVEIVRNTPQLTQIVFIYFAVLQALPQLRQSLNLGAGVFLNVRGLYIPSASGPWWDGIVGATLLGVLAAGLLWRRLGMQLPRLLVLPPILLLGIVAAGFTASWDAPALKGFNFAGGVRIPPEVLAIVLGVSIYCSAFIAENVRAAILGIHRGQSEAARSLGLTGTQTMALVILPQALRILIPPLTNQYLNIIKSTTLGAAIAYPEILQIMGRTVLNQSGRAIEVMSIILATFLTVNVVTSLAMNRWNRKLALQGR